MRGGAGPIDEECRRRFERRWRETDDAPVSEFLPDPSAPAYRGTLLELLLIDLEMRVKRGSAPSVEEYARRFDIDAEARARLEREREELARRHGLPDRRVGKYALRELVGQGATGHVWRAWDPDLSREVALKRLRPGLVASPDAITRFQREARSAARLRHPGIVTVHEVGRDGEDAYLVADLIRGPTLAVALRTRAFAPDEAARLVAQVADALDYAHQCGVVHRDVKPGNILLDEASRPLLADFGLARLAEADATLTRQGDLLGTPAYMSPEQARGETDAIGARSDIYSLGVVLYELLCGRVPFAGENLAAISYAVVHSDPQRPRRIRPTVPVDLESICMKAMAHEPLRRYATAAALAEDLRRFLAREPVRARPRRATTQAALWIRRNPALATSIGTVIVVAAIGLLRVLEERARFREQREQAQASLYRACLREADAQLAAPGGAGRDAAWASLIEATRLDVRSRDPLELRTAALRCLTAEGPYFRRLAEWEEAPTKAALALSHDGKALAEAGERGTHLRDAATGRTLASDPLPANAVAFAPDRPLLATAHADAILLRDAPTLATAARLARGRATRALALAPGGRWLAAAGDGDVAIWDLSATARPPRTLPHAARALAFSPDGDRLAIGSEDGVLRVHDLGTADTHALHDFQNPIPLVAFRDAGDLAAASMELYTICQFDSASDEERQGESRHDAPIRCAFAGPRGLVVTASADGTLGAWDRAPYRVATARAAEGEIRSAAGAGPFVLTVDARGRRALWRIVWTPGRMTWQSEHGVVFVPGTRRIFTGHKVLEIDDGVLVPVPFATRGGVVWDVAADPVHGRFAGVTHDGAVCLWNARTLALEHVLQKAGETSWTAEFSPDGGVLAAGAGSEVALFDTETGRERARLPGHGDDLVVALAFHPRLPLLATAALDRTVRLWSWREAREERQILDGVWVHDLAFMGERLVTACTDGAIRVFDADLLAAERIPVGEDPVWAVAVGPQGLVATGSQSGTVRIWDPGSWRVQAVLGGVPRVRHLAFDDTGRYLAASTWGSPAAVWDLVWLREQVAQLGLDWAR